MGTTPKYAIAYPAGTVAPNVPVVMQQTAESVEAALGKVAGFKHAEYIGASKAQSNGTGATFGALSADTTATFNNDFSQGSVSGGTITILKDGIYLLYGTVLPDAGWTASHLWATGNGFTYMSQQGNGYGSNVASSSVLVYLKTSQVITFGFTANATLNFTSRVKITKIQDL